MGLWFAMLLSVSGCGNGGNSVDAAVDQAIAADLALPDLRPEPILDLFMIPDLTAPPPTGPDYASCVKPYADLTGGNMATISFGFINGKNQYAPYCAVVSLGEPVIWMGTFNTTLADDPLVMASTNQNKVAPTQTALDTATATFAKPGFYGYYSKSNGHDDGTGMAGLIRSRAMIGGWRSPSRRSRPGRRPRPRPPRLRGAARAARDGRARRRRAGTAAAAPGRGRHRHRQDAGLPGARDPVAASRWWSRRGRKNLQEQIFKKDIPLLAGARSAAVHRRAAEGDLELPLPAPLRRALARQASLPLAATGVDARRHPRWAGATALGRPRRAARARRRLAGVARRLVDAARRGSGSAARTSSAASSRARGARRRRPTSWS